MKTRFVAEVFEGGIQVEAQKPTAAFVDRGFLVIEGFDAMTRVRVQPREIKTGAELSGVLPFRDHLGDTWWGCVAAQP